MIPQEFCYPVRYSTMSKNYNKVPAKIDKVVVVADLQKERKQEEERDWLEKVGIDNIYLLLFFMFNAENKKW